MDMEYYLDQQTFPHPLCLLTVAVPLEPEKVQLYFLFTSIKHSVAPLCLMGNHNLRLLRSKTNEQKGGWSFRSLRPLPMRANIY